MIEVGKFGSGAATVSDSKSNTWTALTTREVGSAAVVRLYYCVSPNVGAAHTFTISGTSIFPEIAARAFSGVNVGSAFGAESAGGGGDGLTTLQPGSLTPSEDNALVVTGVASYNESPASINGGYTAAIVPKGGNCLAGGLAYLIQTSAGATNPTWTLTGSGNATATAAWFKAAAVAGGNRRRRVLLCGGR